MRAVLALLVLLSAGPLVTAAEPADSIATQAHQLIVDLVRCGTRHSLSSWTDPKRGIGCGRTQVVSYLQRLAARSDGRLKVVVDRFEATGPRTNDKPVPLENVYAILAGTDPRLAKRAFVISGHLDSIASDVMDATSDAPGADDDGSGVAVVLLAAQALSQRSPRATLVFAVVSGEEQRLLGSYQMKAWLERQGYVVAGMITCDICGATNGAEDRRLRVFSEGGPDGVDSPSRELARRFEELVGPTAIRMIFRRDRFGRGGDHLPFIEAGLPAIRLTEPLEDYRHQHQTPRIEQGVQYGDLPEFLDDSFLARVVELSTRLLGELGDAPAPPTSVWLGGAVTPSARITIEADPDEQRAGFELLQRETTAPRWALLRRVEQPGEIVLDGVSTDNSHFAVRAVGKNGQRSIAVPAVAPPKKQR